MRRKTIYSVEEVEGRDGSVSTEWKDYAKARKRMAEVLAKPGYGVTRVRIWRSDLCDEEKVK